MQQGNKLLQKMWQSNSRFFLNTMCYVWGYPIQHITEYQSPYFLALWWLHHVMGMLVIVKNWEVFQDKKEAEWS